MTISNAARRSAVFVGNGIATAYPFGFKTLDKATIVVHVADENDLHASVLVNGVDYTVTLNADQGAAPGGSINYAGLAVGHRLVVTSATSYAQPLSISNQGAFHAKVLEDSLDRTVIQVQQLAEKLDRAATLPATSNKDPATYLPDILDTLDQATGAAVIAVGIAAGVAEGARDDAAISAGNALISEGNALTSAGNALASAGNAAISAGQALDSKNAAAISEGNASDSAGYSAGYSSNAAGYAGEAQGYKDSAAFSENAALNYRNATEGFYESTFTRRNEAYDFRNDAADSAIDAQAWAASVVGQGASFRNKLINGNFHIWQRGDSQTTSGYSSSDRWIHYHSSPATKTVSKVVLAVGGEGIDGSPINCLGVNVTNGGNSTSEVVASQAIENVNTAAGKQLTVSFWAKASVAGRYIGVGVGQNFGSGGSPSAEVSLPGQRVTLTTTWAKYSVTFDVPSVVGKVIGTTGNDRLSVGLWCSAGSNFNAKVGSIGNQTGTFYIANVQAEEGPVATPFEQRPYGLELSLCQRYFQQISSMPCSGVLYTSNGDNRSPSLLLPVVMRTTPTAFPSSSYVPSIGFGNAGAYANLNFWLGTSVSPTVVKFVNITGIPAGVAACGTVVTWGGYTDAFNLDAEL